jgi:hypothetical protein
MQHQSETGCRPVRPDSSADSSPFGVLLAPEWEQAISEGVASGVPAELAVYPLLIPEAGLVQQTKVAEGLGYDVFRIGNQWVLKITAERHPDAISPAFIRKQAESYSFLRQHLGDEFVCLTYLFRCPIGGKQRSCEVQRFVAGKSLQDITDQEIKGKPKLQQNLLTLVGRILRAYEIAGRVPDFWDTGFLKSARYTKNILVDEDDHPWLIDVGAWPEGFSESSGLKAKIRVLKIVNDMRRFQRWLESLPAAGSRSRSL